MTVTDPNNDPAWREKLADVLRSWAAVGIVGPAWSVDYSPGDGCFRMTFTLFATWGPRPRSYSMLEPDFCSYVQALADWDPDAAGEAAVALAEEVREEAPSGQGSR